MICDWSPCFMKANRSVCVLIAEVIEAKQNKAKPATIAALLTSTVNTLKESRAVALSMTVLLLLINVLISREMQSESQNKSSKFRI